MEDEMGFTGKLWLGIWRTVVQLFYIAVVLSVFDALHMPLAILIVAMGGILYCTIRSVGIGTALYLMTMFSGVAVDFERLKMAVVQDYSSDILADLHRYEKAVGRSRTKIYFELVGVSVVFFICLFQIFENSSSL